MTGIAPARAEEAAVRAPVLVAGRRLPTSFLPVHNPARTTEVVGEVAAGSAADADAAVRAAHAALPSWSHLTVQQRAELLEHAATALEQGVADRAMLLTREQGKVLWESSVDVGGPSRVLRYFLGLAEEFARDQVSVDQRGTVIVTRRAMGVTAVIVPWNYPVYLAFQHVAPALLAGNTVVVKPSELAPLAIGQTLALLAAALPPGVVNIVPGTGAEVGSALVRHPLVRKVLFTGSTATGQQIMREAAGTVKSLGLELGGNDPALVLASARVTDELVDELVRAVYTCAGQVCFNVKRIYAHTDHYADLVERFTAAADQIVVGDGLDPRSTIGPLNNAGQQAKVSALIDGVARDGGTVTTVGRKLDASTWDQGYFMLPSVVTGLHHSSELVACEQFGPVVPIVPFTSEDEAVALANDSEFGLAASVWSDDVDHALSVARRIEAGSVFVNVHRMGASDMTMPFGGVKQSGLGRTHGMTVLEECSELQAIAHRSDRAHLPGPPRTE